MTVRRDPLFWLALVAAPAACLLLAALPGTRLVPAWPEDWLTFLMALAVYPPVEEWLFRGELQPFVARRFRGGWGPVSSANAFTSVVFAALHLLFHPPAWAVAVFLPSLVFGFFRERSDGLAAPIVLHAGYNAAYFLLLAAA